MTDSNSKAAQRQAKAAAERVAQEKAERRRRFLMIGSVLVIMVLIVGGAFLASKLVADKQESDREAAIAPAGESEYGVTIGPEDAPHQVVIYEDFLCPFCGMLEEETRDDLAALAEEGKVLVDYRPFELLGRFGDYSLRATNAFVVVRDAAGADVAKEFHDLLFENQPAESGPFPSDDEIIDLAVEAGADEDEIRDDIENLAQEDWVDDATEDAIDAGVSGTPTILVDGEQFDDGRTVEELADNLIAAVE